MNRDEIYDHLFELSELGVKLMSLDIPCMSEGCDERAAYNTEEWIRPSALYILTLQANMWSHDGYCYECTKEIEKQQQLSLLAEIQDQENKESRKSCVTE